MSFGTKEYQHRYFKEKSNNNRIVNQNYSTIIPSSPLGDHQIIQNIPLSNSVLHNGKAVVVYNPGPLDEYSYNTLMLDRYKLDAELYRKHKRYGSSFERYESLPPISRLRTEPYYRYIEPIHQKYLINPERLAEYDLFIKNRELMHSYVEKQRQKSEKYKRKYTKLKERFQNELWQLKLKNEEQRRRREFEQQEKKIKINEIQHAVVELSDQLVNNSKIMKENVRLNRELEKSREESRTVLFPMVPTILETPIVFNKTKLDEQTMEMNRLRRQISEIDSRIGLGYHRTD